MKLRGARQSIHDAFAIHLTTPDSQGGGGKFDSARWAASTTTAGLVIKATLDQAPHLRGMAIFMNAPDPSITQKDIAAMKAQLWTDFVTRVKPAAVVQGMMVAYMDRIIVGYRSRVRDNKSDLYTAGAMFADYHKTRAQQLTMLANQMIDILAQFDTVSLEPVYAVIDAERDR